MAWVCISCCTVLGATADIISILRARFLQKRVRNPEFDEELQRIVADTEPVECHAPAGSVIFWHARLVHSAGRNSGTGVRSGVIYEYYKKEDPALDNSLLAEVERGNLPDMWYMLSPSYCCCDPMQFPSIFHVQCHCFQSLYACLELCDAS